MKSIRNYSLIIALLQKKKEVTLREIAAYLEANDVRVSQRTIERYIQELRDGYGIISDCDRRTNRYSFSEENEACLSPLLHLFHLVQSSELLAESIKNKEKALSCLLFEASTTDAGSVNLEPIYTAIIQSKVISFDHESFERQQISRYSIRPYLLKEYNAKWYVIGVFGNSDAVRIFGLDRISNVHISDETFEKTEQTRILSLFDFLIGLVYDMEKPATVELFVSPMQAKYFKKTPLHATQEIISETEKGVVFRYYLIPNRELTRLILGYGSQIKVLKPEWFVTQIREQLAEMISLYEKIN
jgi:predicted DNA-binding transcriptional regulator YafY